MHSTHLDTSKPGADSCRLIADGCQIMAAELRLLGLLGLGT